MPMDGFLVIDKPAGWTSHDAVARVRRVAHQKRVGHAGTLDPDATGILLVCLGAATRLIEYTDRFLKTYRAVLALGVETDSQDATGVVTATHDASSIAEETLLAALNDFRGDVLQVPPMVSAVHHEGRRLYEIARAGEIVERKPRPVTISYLKASQFVSGTVAEAALEVTCSSGTYIRTLCADIGSALGVGGHMKTLRRTSVGPFAETDSVALEDLNEETLRTALRPAMELLPRDWPVVPCNPAMADEIIHGRTISASGDGELAAAVLGANILAVLRRKDDTWQPVKVFIGRETS